LSDLKNLHDLLDYYKNNYKVANPKDLIGGKEEQKQEDKFAS
jgi:hypothetical protein